ncbi:MAG: multifunctional CCA addition/repair protein [Pseudomonadales bacterium]|jgi:tRNA nucleotidyltransferase (CCA-adding enzyme)|nr:multifunctional CCA addition/repair protein [Pseudomonadales bacterium]
MRIHLVGGAVRDALLDLPVKDRDWVVVGATVQDMLNAGYRQVGRDFPVFLHPKTQEEYALARTERKQGSGYKGFVVHADPSVTLEQDLIRRDLTINAMARDENGDLIDPFGGKRDLDARLLRHVSPAFAEDPLRVLRVARFAARFAHLGFTVAPETLELMRTLSHSGELEALTPERVWQEIEGGLKAKSPSVFFEVLRACAALPRLLPEIQALFGVPQSADIHSKIDTGLHSLMVLEQAAKSSEDLAVRFAALMHDLGKGATSSTQRPEHTGHADYTDYTDYAERGAVLIEALAQRLRVPNDCRDLAMLASRYHWRCHHALHHDAAQRYATLELTDALRRPLRFEQLLLVCAADARGRSGFEQAPYPQRALLQQALTIARGVDVQAVLNATPSAKTDIAALIRAARIAALAANPWQESASG